MRLLKPQEPPGTAASPHSRSLTRGSLELDAASAYHLPSPHANRRKTGTVTAAKSIAALARGLKMRTRRQEHGKPGNRRTRRTRAVSNLATGARICDRAIVVVSTPSVPWLQRRRTRSACSAPAAPAGDRSVLQPHVNALSVAGQRAELNGDGKVRDVSDRVDR
jgi:hypothetical protein